MSDSTMAVSSKYTQDLSVQIFLFTFSFKWFLCFYFWPRLLEKWITLSTGQITIQRIGWFVLSTLIHWKAIYPVDSVIQPLNNRALGCNLSHIVDLFAGLHELASASARTLLKLGSSVRALLNPYGDTLSAHSCDAMYHVLESRSRLELFCRMFFKLFLPCFFGPRLEYMFERSLKLSPHIPKRFDAFQVLKWFLLLLEATCVIFARVTNTDVWQAIVTRATKSRKNWIIKHSACLSYLNPIEPSWKKSLCTHGLAQ